jgi:hypothetical protein
MRMGLAGCNEDYEVTDVGENDGTASIASAVTDVCKCKNHKQCNECTD